MTQENQNLIRKLSDARLSRADSLVLFTISILDGMWSEGQRQLGCTLGLSRRTVNRSIGRLERIGYVKRLDGKPKPIILTI